MGVPGAMRPAAEEGKEGTGISGSGSIGISSSISRGWQQQPAMTTTMPPLGSGRRRGGGGSDAKVGQSAGQPAIQHDSAVFIDIDFAHPLQHHQQGIRTSGSRGGDHVAFLDAAGGAASTGGSLLSRQPSVASAATAASASGGGGGGRGVVVLNASKREAYHGGRGFKRLARRLRAQGYQVERCVGDLEEEKKGDGVPLVLDGACNAHLFPPISNPHTHTATRRRSCRRSSPPSQAPAETTTAAAISSSSSSIRSSHGGGGGRCW